MNIDYPAIAEQDHLIQNPTSYEKLERVIDYCSIKDGQSVLDIGCGKAWLLRRMAERAAIKGVGVDKRPVFLEAARQAMAGIPLKGSVERVTMPALSFDRKERFDVTPYETWRCPCDRRHLRKQAAMA
jgi:cyclopropane fatty-acyl-phospholipid synthase-like methyltransferase